MTDYIGQTIPRSGTFAEWSAENPDDHLPGERLYETDTGREKRGTGDGTPYLELPYEPFKGRTPAAADISYAGSTAIPAGTVEAALDSVGALAAGKASPASVDAVADDLAAHEAEVGWAGGHMPTPPDGTPDDYVYRADGTWGPAAGGGGGDVAASDVEFSPAAGIGATNVQGALVELAGDVTAAAAVADAATTSGEATTIAANAVAAHADDVGAGFHLPAGGSQHMVPARTATPGEVAWVPLEALRVGVSAIDGLAATTVQGALVELAGEHFAGASSTVDWDGTLNAGNGAWVIHSGNPATAAIRDWRGPTPPVLTPADPLADLWAEGDNFLNTGTGGG